MAVYVAGLEIGDDPYLLAANIKYGITIDGVSGHTNVRDSSDADAVAGDVASGKTFYAGGGGIKTGEVV